MNPILLDIPGQLETARLNIRMPMPGDGRVVFEAVQASLNELKPWLPFANDAQSQEATEINIRESHLQYLKREDLRFLLFDKENGTFIGSSGLHHPDWEVRKFEIGYWMDSRHSGKGYMTEAVKGITEFAFNQLQARRVMIRCDERNVKSRAIPERLGYDLEGILRNDDRTPDTRELRNTYIYAKVN